MQLEKEGKVHSKYKNVKCENAFSAAQLGNSTAIEEKSLKRHKEKGKECFVLCVNNYQYQN